MRGTVSSLVIPWLNRRITPACAGNRRPGILDAGAGQDHPRVCGEQFDQRLQPLHAIGSPPRVRGTGVAIARDLLSVRITPACAGNRAGRAGWSCRTRDHPRVCGEQAGCSGEEKDFVGSPPRVRGTGNRGCGYGEEERITPACAGNRAILFFEILIPQDHPRVCGEQGAQHGCRARFVGSPPRVRGTVPHALYHERNQGITPACAGNSIRLLQLQAGQEDHPRVCGEQPSAFSV